MDYFLRFTERFPDVASLASAEEDEVLKYWQGLGYYSRARNLHAAAKDIMERFGGIFPERYEDVISLKGIGEYTAAAIVSLCMEPAVSSRGRECLPSAFAPVCGRYSDRYAQREKSLYGTGRLGDGPPVCRATQPGYNGIGRLAMRAAKSGLRSLSVERALRCLWGGRCADLSGETEKRPGRVTGIFIIYTLYIKEKPGCPAGKGKTFGKDSTSFRLSKRTRRWILQSCRRRMLFVGCLQERAG